MSLEASPTSVLALGTTGMLADVTLELALEGRLVAVISRRADEFVARQADTVKSALTPLNLDYRDSDMLRAVISKRIAEVGPPSLVLAWIHDDAPEAARIIAGLVDAAGRPFRFIHVRSAAGLLQPESSLPYSVSQAGFPNMRYQEVVLGCIKEAGSWRWLTDAEICSGVLETLRSDDAWRRIGDAPPAWS